MGSYHSGAAGRENLNESIEEPKTVQDPVQTEITSTPDPVKEAQDPVEESVQDPVEESVQDPVEESVQDPVRETKAQEPVAQDPTNNEHIEHDGNSNTNETDDNNKLGSDDP